MQIDSPEYTYPDTLFPTTENHMTPSSKNFNPINIVHYVRIIMFGCFDPETRNVITTMALGQRDNVELRPQGPRRDYIMSKNLFNNELLVVSISMAAKTLARCYSLWLVDACNGLDGAPKIVPDDANIYRNMATFQFTAGLLLLAKRVGINPNLDIDPKDYGFKQADVDKYGYFLQFVLHLPAYAEALWTMETRCCKSVMKQTQLHALLLAEAQLKVELETEPSNQASSRIPERFVDVEDFKIDMLELSCIVKVHNKVTLKKGPSGQSVLSMGHADWDMVPFPVHNRPNLKSLKIIPSINTMWEELFSTSDPTPLQKLLVMVNSGIAQKDSKKPISKKEVGTIIEDCFTTLDTHRQAIGNVLYDLTEAKGEAKGTLTKLKVEEFPTWYHQIETTRTKLLNTQLALTDVATALQCLKHDFITQPKPKAIRQKPEKPKKAVTPKKDKKPAAKKAATQNKRKRK
jgi:hypothetical protein